MTSKDAYIQKMKLQLHELHSRMAELEVKARLAKDDALDKCNKYNTTTRKLLH